MMRGTVSLILISLVALQPASVAAQEPAPNPDLQRLLHDVPGEVARFSEFHPSPIYLSDGSQTASQEADKADLIRAKAQEIQLGTEVMFTLTDGQEITGELTDATDVDFTVRVSVSKETRRVQGDDATTRTNYRFTEVRTLFAGQDPWGISPGKRVEVRLVGGEKVRGRLLSVDDNGIKVEGRQFTFDETLSVRKLGMRRAYKILIAVGAVLGLLVAVCGACQE